MSKVISMEQALSYIEDGSTIMIGGFGAVGTPMGIVNAIMNAGIKDLTIISNDTGWEDRGLGILVTARRVRKVIVSHIGTNKQSGAQLNAGELEVELVPQGTLAERIRCAAFGLGGALTPTGIGTAVEEGKQSIVVQDKQYMLEEPLHADVALLQGAVVDKAGNITYKGAMVNFNHVMAGAATVTIVEASKLVEIGEIDPNHVVTPGIFVDYVVEHSCGGE